MPRRLALGTLLAVGVIVLVVLLIYVRSKAPNVLGTYDLQGQLDFSGQDVRLPPGIRARVTVLPDGAIKPGDTVRLVTRIWNDKSTDFTGLNISVIPDTKVAEFVAASPLPDFADPYIKWWGTTGWLNTRIPAKSSKDFSITYRVSPSQAGGSSLTFTVWVGGADEYQADRTFGVPISKTKGSQTAVNTNAIDNYFRVATGRFPTSAERNQWTNNLQQFRATDKDQTRRTALFIKEIAKKVGSAPASSAPAATATSATPTPTPAITAKDFKVLGPDSFNTHHDDQEITWHASQSVKEVYPKVKVELCPGKDFKGCIVLIAVADNDGAQSFNMPPVPRIGKWYVHLIGRDANGKLNPSLAASRLVTLHQ